MELAQREAAAAADAAVQRHATWQDEVNFSQLLSWLPWQNVHRSHAFVSGLP